MPPYPHLAATELASRLTSPRTCATNRTVGVPYTDEMIERARADLRAQADPEGDHEALLERYPKAAVGDFDGDPDRLTEMDALVAYLQILGRMVDFTARRAPSRSCSRRQAAMARTLYGWVDLPLAGLAGARCSSRSSPGRSGPKNKRALRARTAEIPFKDDDRGR